MHIRYMSKNINLFLDLKTISGKNDSQYYWPSALH